MPTDKNHGENTGKPLKRQPPEHTKWKPGKSANPNGRPKGVLNRSTIAKRVLEMTGVFPEDALKKIKKIFPEVTNKMTIEEIITIIQAKEAVMGKVLSYNALMDSAYGKATQALTNPNGDPLEVAMKIESKTLKAMAEAFLQTQTEEENVERSDPVKPA